MAGGKIGEAWYELGARDAPLGQAVDRAEQKLRSASKAGEQAFGSSVQKNFDDTGKAADRLGGRFSGLHLGTGKLGGAIRDLGGGVMQGIGIAGMLGMAGAATTLVGGINTAITAASDWNESLNVLQQAFGKSADSVIAFAKDSSQNVLLTQNAAVQAAGGFGALFTSMKIGQPASAAMSIQLTKLASDLSSFYNVDTNDALESLKSGLVGETEPLRRFGVMLNQAQIQQEAVKLGLISTTKQAMTPAIQAQATYALILEQTSVAQGDAARTAGGFANSQRIASKNLQDALMTIGQMILPLASAALPLLSGALLGLVNAIGLVLGVIGPLTPGFAALGVVLIAQAVPGLLATGAGALAAVPGLFAVGGALNFLMGPIGLVVAAVTLLGLAFSTNFLGIGDLVRSVVGTVGGLMKELAGSLVDGLWTVANAAAAIPGPTQGAMNDLKATLQGAKADIDKWGTTTADTAQSTAQAIPDALHGALPATDDAAAALAGATPAALAAAKPQAVTIAKLTAAGVADSLRDGRGAVGTAADALKQAFDDHVSKTKEVAQLRGDLAGKQLARALKSNDPEIRARGEAYKQAIEDRLFALQHGVAAYALKTGMSYADALAAKKKQVADAALAHTKAVEHQYDLLRANADDYGEKTGDAYAAGIKRAVGKVINGALYLTTAAGSILHASSPPDNPLNPLHDIDEWGARTAQAYGDGMASQRGYLANTVRSLLGGGVLTGNVVASLSAVTGPRLTIEHVIRDPDRAIERTGGSTRDVARYVAESLDVSGLLSNLQHVASIAG